MSTPSADVIDKSLPSLPGYLAPLNARARERLADNGHIDLYVECFVDADHVTGPAWAVFRLDMAFLELVETASSSVIKHPYWRSVDLQRWPTSWDQEGSDITVKRWSLTVTNDAMSFRGQPKEGPDDVESCEVPLKELVEALNADEMATLRVLTDESMPVDFVWRGGVLVHGVTDVAELARMVEETSDEIAAKHAANMMRHEIETRATASPASLGTNPSPRKPRIRV